VLERKQRRHREDDRLWFRRWRWRCHPALPCRGASPIPATTKDGKGRSIPAGVPCRRFSLLRQRSASYIHTRALPKSTTADDLLGRSKVAINRQHIDPSADKDNSSTFAPGFLSCPPTPLIAACTSIADRQPTRCAAPCWVLAPQPLQAVPRLGQSVPDKVIRLSNFSIHLVSKTRKRSKHETTLQAS
jgi:hypothetical protein